jgi:hypothetical protein
MHARRLACFLLGMWLAGGIFMAWIATQNFREVDRLLSRADPVATLRLKPLGADARMTLRYQASEQNRRLFRTWETVQILFGASFFLLLLFGSRENKFTLVGVLLLIALVLVQKFVLTPELIALGRMIDFVPPDIKSPDRSKFWVIHSAYSGVELLKRALIVGLSGKMVFSRQRSGRSRDSRREVDRVDKANYRSVNR